MLENPDLARGSTDLHTEILTVSQLNQSVRDLIEHRYPLLWVRGEISNFLVARSGHAYFILKDSRAQIRCVMFKSRGENLAWDPQDGAQVEAQGLVTLYETRGEFQLVVERMRPAGRGALYEAYLRLKDRLEAEGVFDATLKRPLPFLPRAIGVITSPQAAALSDVLTALKRRNPSIPVIVYPAPVQGPDAGAAIARALAVAGYRNECDVLILCRGGGSIEDLWPFNEEQVARSIRACPIPVVCGVGHETDFTIADFAADRRAATPTAAGELVSPIRSELLQGIASLARRLSRLATRELEIRSQALDYVSRRLAHPAQRVAELSRLLDQARARLSRAMRLLLDERRRKSASFVDRIRTAMPRPTELDSLLQLCCHRLVAAVHLRYGRHQASLAALSSALDHLAPTRVLERGFSLVRDASGRIVKDGASLQHGDRVSAEFARGGAELRVERTR